MSNLTELLVGIWQHLAVPMISWHHLANAPCHGESRVSAPTRAPPGLVAGTFGPSGRPGHRTGRAVGNRASATLLAGTSYLLAGTSYLLVEVDPLTGRVRIRGTFPRNAQVAGIAISPVQ